MRSSSDLLWTRRDALRAGSLSAAAVIMPAASIGRLPLRQRQQYIDRQAVLAPLVDPDVFHIMAMRAIDAAKTAGAAYADVRVTRTVSQEVNVLYNQVDAATYSPPSIVDDEQLSIGVRALVNGTWGFASSTYWGPDEPAQLARDAVAIAVATARRFPGTVELAPVPVVTGTWTTPIKIDPFSIPIEEKMDFAEQWTEVLRGRYDGPDPDNWLSNSRVEMPHGDAGSTRRQERAVATTDGSYVRQTTYEISVDCGVAGAVMDGDGVPVAGKTRLGAGWEVLTEFDLESLMLQMSERNRQQMLAAAPAPLTKPVEIGRYDVVCDASSMASLVNATLAQATELDRVEGAEANASGTSWLGPRPLDMLGTAVGSSLLNLQTNRTTPRGLATIKWDDEGVESHETPLIRDGVLVEYQTTREGATRLTPYAAKVGRSVRSTGGAGSDTALDVPMSRCANIIMRPGTGTTSFDDMVAATKRGFALVGYGVRADWQQRGVTGTGNVREIINGRLGAIVEGAGLVVNAPELWKNLTAVGGTKSAMTVDCRQFKGEPTQLTSYSVRAPAGAFKNLTFVDVRRTP